jgi:hypothetical protein
VAERKVSRAERRRLEAEGETGYGESFPLGDCDEIRRAVESYGRAPEEHRAGLRRKIIQRAREEHCTEHIPDDWEIS